jgi:hypothetical protein
MPHGRGAGANPPNRFDPLHVERDDGEDREDAAGATRFFVDTSRSVLVANQSPDVACRWGINPYRGCEHGCVYCFARPTHEYLGFSAGLDFESRIMVKADAPELLQRALAAPTWRMLHHRTISCQIASSFDSSTCGSRSFVSSRNSLRH